MEQSNASDMKKLTLVSFFILHISYLLLITYYLLLITYYLFDSGTTRVLL